MAFYYDKDGYRVEMPSTASPSVPTSQYYYDKDGYRVPMSSAKTSTATMPDFYYDQNGYRVEIPKTSDVEGLYNKYNEIVNGYTQRYSQSGYRADYADWKRNTYNSTSEMSATSAKIRKNLETYRKVYGDEYADSVLQLIDGIDKGIVALNDAAENEYKIFSQYATEEDYNNAVAAYEEEQRLLTYDVDAAQARVKELNDNLTRVMELYDERKYAMQSGNKEAVAKAEEELLKLSLAPDLPAEQAMQNIVERYNRQIDALEDEIDLAKSTKEVINWNSISDPNSELYDPDFERYVAIGADTKNKPKKVYYDNSSQEYVSANDKGIQNPAAFVRNGGRIGNTDSNYDFKLSDDAKRYLAMSEEEFEMYNYFLGKYGKKRAEEYVDWLEKSAYSLTARVASKEFEEILQGNRALEYFYGVAAGLDQFGTGIRNLFSNKDYYRPSVTQYKSSYVREDLKNSGPQVAGNSLGQIVYDVTTTSSAMMPSILTSVFVGSVNPVAGEVAGSALMGASASGNAYAEMVNLGYSKGQARTYSLLVGASEATLQYLLGGIGKLGGKLSSGVTKGLVSKLDDILAKVAINYGDDVVKALQKGTKAVTGFTVDALSEGLEESLQEVIDPLFKAVALGDYDAEVDWEEALYSGILGVLTSAGMNTTSAAYNKVSQVIANKNADAFTQNEQVVFDKIVENCIAELEAKGEKATSAEKKNIEKVVRQEFENGEISTSDIEEALGEAFFGVGESDKRILSSYRETALRGEKFSADLSKYSEKQRGVVQSAIDSGILNNSSRTHKFVDFVAKLAEDKGVNFSFINNQKLKESGFAIEGKDVAGYVKGNDIAVNIDSSKSLNSIVGHEIAHVLEGTELYDVLATAVKNYATTKGEWNSRLESTARLYSGISEDAEGELVADLIGDYLFTDSKFLERLSVEHQNLFQRLWSEVKYLCRIATAGSKELRQLEKVKKAFEDAYRNTKPAEKNTDTESDGVKYSLNKEFSTQYDRWDKEKIGFSFLIGTTSEALSSIGVAKKSIYWDAGKIKKIRAKHPNMSDDIIKQVPNIIEEPILVMESKTVKGRLTLFGEVYDTAENPVLAILELNPTNKNGEHLDVMMVASAYGKDSNPQAFINNSVIRYVNPNKKRTNSWLSANGLQLPRPSSSISSSNTNIPQSTAGVNNNSMQNGRKNSLVSENQSREAVGDYNVYGRDVKLASDEVVPVQERQNNVDTEEYDSSFEDFDRQRREDLEALDDTDEVGARQGDVFVEDNTVEVINDQDLQYITNILKDTLYLNSRQVGEIKKIVRDYSSAEHPSKTRLKAEIQSRFGTVKFTEKVEEIEAIKKELRGRDIKVSDAIKNDIADYSDFYRSHYRKLSLKESGTPVDSLYMELSNNYPDFFPEDIINPSDQLQRIAEVVDMDTYNRGEYEVDEERIQKAVDVIAEGVGRYRRVKKTSKATATTEERVFQRRQEIETYIESDNRERNRRFADYTQQIDDLMAEYDNLENQNSATAIDLQYRIQELRRKRSIDDERFSEKLKRHDKSLERVEDGTYATAIQRKSKQAELMEWAKDLLGDTSMWKDKKFGISYKVNTLHRNLRDIVRDKNGKADYKKADEIYDATAGTYNHNEALLNRESARIKKQFTDMKINPVESEYIQMLGEFRHNPETTLEEQDVMNFYEKNHKKIDERKVEAAIELARKTYDDLFERVNAVLKEQGMKEIPYRKGYFPHFVEEKQGVLAKFFNWKSDNNRIPDDVIGITETFKPSRSWQSFNKRREGDTTDYDFLKGLDRYIQGSLDWIYHIEDIQKRRAIENYIRYTHSEKGVQERIDEIEQSDVYNADEAEAQRNLVFAEAENSIGNFLNDFRTQTNTLAGKKSTLDRDIEELANRQVYSTMKNISGRVTANMVAGSVSSALTNFIPITQSWMQVSPKSTLVAMAETMRNVVRDDGTIEKSDFLTNRLRPSEKLDKRTWDKIIDKAGIMMEVVDNFSAQTIWRSKYNENIQNGMSEVEAIKNADEFSENVMAGRSRGNAPTLFDAKNPVAKIFTAFQLEVNNQYGYMFKDAPRDLKNEGIVKLVKGYATMFIGAYVFNALYSSLVGRDSAFDPIGIVEDLLKDIGAGDEDEKEDSVGGVVSNLIDNVVDELPFVSGIAGGGRIPLSSMLPYGDVVSTVKETINDIESGEWERLGAEWLNPVYYLGLPIGGGQIRKTIQGLSMYNTNGDRPIAGSYTDSGALRFPVEKDPFSVAQAAIFGQWSSKNARDYFAEGRSPLTEKQLSEFVQMGEDMTIQEYWDYLDDMSELKTAEEKVNYIVNLDLPLQKKNVLVNNIFNRKNPVDLQGFGELSGFAEWDFSMKNPEKYQFLKENEVAYQLYAFSKNTKETYDDDYQWYKSNPEKVTLSKAVAGTVVEYREIARKLNAIKADKDENGNPIPNSAKEKKIDYIDSLDELEHGAKLILYKDIYPGDDSVNDDIIEYVNGLDLTAAEKKTILKELNLR